MEQNEGWRPIESAPFKREDRYIVVKRSHISQYSQEGIEKAIFSAISKEVEWNGHRHLLNNGGQVACVVVEKDWPEYETVWQMIEARVTGQSHPIPGDVATPIERTAEQERAAIVAWLRRRQRAHELAFEKALAFKGKDHPHLDKFAAQSMAIEEAADAIERGEHLSTESEETHD